MTAGRTVNSQSQHWGTPKKYVDAVREFFGGTIELDPCSNSYSIVNAEKEYLLPHRNGLLESWNAKTIYVNPPYGTDYERGARIIDWFRKCEEAFRLHGAEVLALVPVATNTTHWKRYVFGKATSVSFLYDTRLKFLVNGQDEGKGAPMACAMVYWGKYPDRFEEIFGCFGASINIECLKGKSIGEFKDSVARPRRVGKNRELSLPFF